VTGAARNCQARQKSCAAGYRRFVIPTKALKPLREPEIVSPADMSAKKPRVFIVQGHDEDTREKLAVFLYQLGFDPVILHDQPNKGRTLITKFIEEASNVGFAVVVMTPDDQGGKVGGPANFRARQNVVFELGFMIGVLGSNKVVALIKDSVERPSDIDGSFTSTWIRNRNGSQDSAVN
jgi:predicted nucleotide-binding protein